MDETTRPLVAAPIARRKTGGDDVRIQEKTGAGNSAGPDGEGEACGIQDEDSRAKKPRHTLEELRHAVRKQPMHRHLYRKILVFIEEERTTEEVEAFIAAQPEFEFAVQPEGRFLVVLESAGGIVRREADALQSGTECEAGDGTVPVVPAAMSGQAPDQSVGGSFFATVDDGAAESGSSDDRPSIVGARWAKTDLGAKYVEETDPSNALSELLLSQPERASAYLAVLAACNERPRSLAEIAVIVEATGGASKPNAADGDPSKEGAPLAVSAPAKPSVFVDKLERAGGLYWSHAWNITDEGRECLENSAVLS